MLVALLAPTDVPVNSASQKLLVSTVGGPTVRVVLPSSVDVAIHIADHAAAPMVYAMHGPGGGRMYRRGGMMDGDSYSLWSNGGRYEGWAGYPRGGYGPMPV